MQVREDAAVGPAREHVADVHGDAARDRIHPKPLALAGARPRGRGALETLVTCAWWVGESTAFTPSTRHPGSKIGPDAERGPGGWYSSVTQHQSVCGPARHMLLPASGGAVGG